MKLFYKQIFTIIIPCVYFSSYINGMKQIDEAKLLRCKMAALAKANRTWINVPDCRKIISLELTRSEEIPLIIKTTYILNNKQTKEDGSEEGIVATWNYVTRQQLSSSPIEIKILSDELLRPGSNSIKDDEAEDDDFKIHNPIYPQQFIGRRKKDKTLVLYMAEPFTQLCYLAKRKNGNPKRTTFSPDGNYIVATRPQRIVIWDISKKNNIMKTLENPKKWQLATLEKCLHNEPVRQSDKKWLKEQFDLQYSAVKNPNNQVERQAKR